MIARSRDKQLAKTRRTYRCGNLHGGSRIGHGYGDRFRRRLDAPAGDEKPERETDVDYWLREFGVEDTEQGDGS